VSRTGPGLDPRIIIPAVLAQQQAARRKPGIPLISDEEAERRQREADLRRRRRVLWLRTLVVLAVVAVGVFVASWLGLLSF
jgi:hypothetical protein